MIGSSFENMLTVFDPPVYVYQESSAGCFCDKFILHVDAGSWVRKRYYIEAGACTCLGYIKFQRCKHLTMFNDETPWPVTGVSREVAIVETGRLIQSLFSKFPKSSKSWKPDPELIPARVTVLTLNMLADEAPYAGASEYDKITSIRKCGEAGTLGVQLKISRKP